MTIRSNIRFPLSQLCLSCIGLGLILLLVSGCAKPEVEVYAEITDYGPDNITETLYYDLRVEERGEECDARNIEITVELINRVGASVTVDHTIGEVKAGKSKTERLETPFFRQGILFPQVKKIRVKDAYCPLEAFYHQ